MIKSLTSSVFIVSIVPSLAVYPISLFHLNSVETKRNQNNMMKQNFLMKKTQSQKGNTDTKVYCKTCETSCW